MLAIHLLLSGANTIKVKQEKLSIFRELQYVLRHSFVHLFYDADRRHTSFAEGY